MHTRKGSYHVHWPRNIGGNSWNYVVICYNLGDVDKYKFMCRDNGSYGIPWPLKWGLSNKQNVSTCLIFGVIAENRSKMAAILNFKMAATRGREYVGGIFFKLPLGKGSYPYPCAKFHACFKNWTILVDIWYLPLYYNWLTMSSVHSILHSKVKLFSNPQHLSTQSQSERLMATGKEG